MLDPLSSPFVLLLCTLWELFARLFFNRFSAFTDQKKKMLDPLMFVSYHL